jgi:ubiquinone/menaquinone biosynthesis C-methylase UbiE
VIYYPGAMQDETVVAEFTQQAESFNTSAVAWATETLDGLVDLAAPQASERWLEAACGPGIVARKLAPRVREVLGVDMTPAMVEVARREAAAAGLANATFAVGDATALDLPDASLDGAIARFTLHHVPVPGRLVGELARVVRPGGHVVLADHLAAADLDASAWAHELERLRDPSHWASLSHARARQLGQQAGLELEQEQVMPILLDFDEWLRRGSGASTAAAQIEWVLAERPEGVECFRISERDGRRVLELQMWMARWRR